MLRQIFNRPTRLWPNSTLRLSTRPQPRVYSFSLPQSSRRNFSQTRRLADKNASKESGKSEIQKTLKVCIVFALLLTFGESVRLATRPDKIFVPSQFTPFTIVSRELVSPSSAILTIRANSSWWTWFTTWILIAPASVYDRYWRKGIWSVEIKQPSRAQSYMPVYPIWPESAIGSGVEDLRFLVETNSEDELSNYLFGLREGSEVELRGPNFEFEMPKNVEQIVFLASGTGILPAIQTILAFRWPNIPRIKILWVNGRSKEHVGDGTDFPDDQTSAKRRETLDFQFEKLKPKKWPFKYKIDCVVDDERVFIDDDQIRSMVNDLDVKSTEKKGSKLLFVSGPEEFVTHLAGPKKMLEADGKQGQGNLGGIIGKMGLQGWTVFKV